MNRILCLAVIALALLPASSAFAENQAEFIEGLVNQEAATYADGVRGVGMIIGGDGPPPSFEEAETSLRQKKIIPGKWKIEPAAPLTRGKLAYMIFKVAGLKEGIGDVLFGLSERTAVSECADNGLVGGGKPDRNVENGLALVLSLQQATLHLERGGRSKQPDLVKIDFNAAKVDRPAETKDAQERLLAALAAGIQKASVQVHATVVAVQGGVWMRSGEKSWVQADKEATVPVGAKLLTGVNSQAQLAFPDGTTILIKPLTELDLVSAGSGACKEGQFYIVRAASSFGTVRVLVGSNSLLSCIQIGSPTSYVTALEGAFEQTAAGTMADTIYSGSKGRISVVQGSW